MLSLLVLWALLLPREGRSTPNDKPQPCYQVGDTIASEVFVCEASGEKKRLLDLVQPDTKAIYLLIFGGPSLNPSESAGGLWCGDSFNDMPTSTYMYRKYHNANVLFVAVACPPVYGETEYGFPGETFLAQPDTAPTWKHEFSRFVEAVYALQSNHVIPFEQVYYDPKLRLLFNHKKYAEGTTFSDAILPWMGRFKPSTDSQSYSVPVIWLLSKEGKVLHEPFAGNRFGTSTQRINYTVREVEAALQEAIGVKK
ncbi:hypothetical protein HUU05_19550 [candidate division KSB1 bacterium]|nr:hypothetical protein [candidate division KSB1 bacterium]